MIEQFRREFRTAMIFRHPERAKLLGLSLTQSKNVHFELFQSIFVCIDLIYHASWRPRGVPNRLSEIPVRNFSLMTVAVACLEKAWISWTRATRKLLWSTLCWTTPILHKLLHEICRKLPPCLPLSKVRQKQEAPGHRYQRSDEN